MPDYNPSACPFCRHPEFSIVTVSYQGGASRMHVRCPQCGAQGPAGENSDVALNLWCDRQPVTATEPQPCAYCKSPAHTELACPKVKAFEFQLSGNIGRVEFKTEADYPPPVVTAIGPIETPTATSSDDVPTS